MSDWHERFWKKVDKQGKNDCWEWKAYRKPDGYFTDVHNAEKVAIALRNHLMANNLLDREKSES